MLKIGPSFLTARGSWVRHARLGIVAQAPEAQGAALILEGAMTLRPTSGARSVTQESVTFRQTHVGLCGRTGIGTAAPGMCLTGVFLI